MLKKIKRFEYPISDLSIIKSCPLLTSIFIDGSNYKNLDALKNSNITSIHVVNARNKKDVDDIISKVKSITCLCSYGYTADWEQAK